MEKKPRDITAIWQHLYWFTRFYRAWQRIAAQQTPKKMESGRAGGLAKALDPGKVQKILAAYDALTKTQKEGAGIAALLAGNLGCSAPTVLKYLREFHPAWKDRNGRAKVSKKNKK
jgi:hypothetical protein